MIYSLFLLLLLSCNLVYAENQTNFKLIESAQQASSQGQFQRAIKLWETVLTQLPPESVLLKNQTKLALALKSQMKLASAYQKLGFFRQAFERLIKARQLAEDGKDKANLALILGQLGDLYFAGYNPPNKTQSGNLQLATDHFNLAFDNASHANNQQVLAEILNKQGNVLVGQKKYSAASSIYQKSQDLAQATGNQLLAAKILINQVELTFLQQKTGFSSPEKGYFVMSKIKEALQVIQQLPACHTKSFGLLALNRLTLKTQQKFGLKPKAIQAIRYQILQSAKVSAEINQDKLSLSHIYGHLGRLYEEKKRYSDALLLTRKALFFAQELALPELEYFWYWQWGRLLKVQGKQESAIKMYQLAINAMQPHNIRGCGTSIQTRLINIGYYDKVVAFRELVAPVYLDLADLLIEQGELDDAIDAFEKLNLIELKNYLRDDCLTEPEEFIDPKVALLHFILLPDRTELLVKISQKVKRFTILIPGDEIHEIASEFKYFLSEEISEYQELATEFYQLFIKPITSFLEQHQITTLVIVPDRALRTIPFAALHDGEHYLIERYAIATSLLGSKIVAADPPSRDDELQVFLGGVSEPVNLKDENDEDKDNKSRRLPYVPDELEGIQKLYPTQSKKFLDVEFIRPVLTTEIKETAYSIIHFASHSSFADAKNSYLLVYNGKIFLEELKQLLLQRPFKEKPIELMTLSACETAKGDDETVLGLGGVAVKAGVKTTLANLWLANDEAAAKLSVAFYKHFKTPGINKAQALQKAQLELLKQPEFQEPSLWAPLILIGNWQ
jgi:CHAT domain-containing protein